MLLESLNSPQDLKKIPQERLPQLAGEVRSRMIAAVAKTGGHLASSLGTVELTIALHYCLDAPKDKIIWDVGHQSYAHKILTGRNKDFDSLRQYRGLSGFPSHEESAYDTFTTGHSSTAVSLALGLVCAQEQLKPEERFKVAAVIGDGSLSGGLCFEGLNNAGHAKKDILVILNTNELSISPNAGAISTYLNKLISLPIYNRFRESLENFMKSRLPKGSRLVKLANKFEEGLKGLFIPGMLFEELGFRYFGPFDGHSLHTLIPALKNILTIKGPVLMHVVTKKGKGYLPAELDPVKFHSAPVFDTVTGAVVRKGPAPVKTYTEVFSEKLAALAKDNPKIVAITAAMPEGTGLDKFRDLYPARFYDVGIAEEHAVCFAAGLAKRGLKPVVAVYSTFLQRAYDQIMECVALQKLGVVFAIDRAGIVGEDGPTHQGIFDLAFLRTIPGLTVMAPSDGVELEAMLGLALSLDTPVAIRYPKDKSQCYNVTTSPVNKIELGKAQILREGKDAAIIALGSMVSAAFAAAQILKKEGIEAAVVNARFLRPLDTQILNKISANAELIFTLEDGICDGGFGSAAAEAINKPVTRMGFPCAFIPHGKREILLERYGLSAEAIAARVRAAFNLNLKGSHG